MSSYRNSIERSATLTRPSNTTAYAAGDLVANDTTAGSVSLLEFKFNTSMGLWLRRVEIRRSQASVTNADFRLWLVNDSAITFTNGDNGALAITSGLALADVVATIDFVGSAGAALTGCGALCAATWDQGLVAIPNTTYAFLEARAAYTPASAETFTIILRGDPY